MKSARMGIIAFAMLLSFVGCQGAALPYRNAQLSLDARVTDLMGRMTLEEKVAQTQSLWPLLGDNYPTAGKGIVDTKGNFDPSKAREVLKFGMGQIARPSEKKGPREMALYTNAIQKYVIEKTRLGIPVLFHEEALHGHAAPKGTCFPQSIALACTWDPDLIEQIFSAVAKEVRSRGAQQVLAPVLDLARDPRWGRTEETYGEDPYLVSRLGIAAIRGFQGKGPGIDKNHVIATMKHFAVHGQPEGGINAAPGNYSERVVREMFLFPFQAAVQEAGVMSVMPSYNEVDGLPSHANKHFLRDILRGEWGFKGYIVSDYGGIMELVSRHSVAGDKAEAARRALETGVDIELPDIDAYGTLVQQINSRNLSIDTLNNSVARLLRAKFLAGLFDDPYADPDQAERVTNSAEHRALALKAAQKAIVLLKNDRGLLPFDRAKLRTLAVIGPNANRAHLGGYSDNPGLTVSILDGVRKKVGSGMKVVYAEGCKITKGGGDWNANTSELSDPVEDGRSITEAVQIARTADAVILVLGGNEDTDKEAWDDNHLGDRTSLDLVGRQDDLAKAILETGKPTVVFLINGRPLSINYVAQAAPAILEGFYLGEETGTAAADVLFGDYNPGGRLPITIPRSAGHLPAFYNYKPTARRGYLFTSKEPLFPFGYGLSYTTFEYADLKLTQSKISPDGRTTVTVVVTNKGKVAGDEVVQMYIRDKVSSVTRPVKELKGFQRIYLEPGKSRTVEFTITPENLSFLDENMKRVVEPGLFDIMVGSSSTQWTSVVLEVRN